MCSYYSVSITQLSVDDCVFASWLLCNSDLYILHSPTNHVLGGAVKCIRRDTAVVVVRGEQLRHVSVSGG